VINLKIEKLEVGYLQTNCYILIKDNNCLIIDPGDEFDKIVSKIGKLNVMGVLITHHHFDHVGALEEIKSKYNCNVYDTYNLDEKEYNINNFIFDVIYTKGHHKTSITFYFKEDKVMFTGDFIFKESIGRTDLDTGNEIEMNKSLEKIKKYPKDITIYPGHGLNTTLEYELNNNMFLRKV